MKLLSPIEFAKIHPIPSHIKDIDTLAGNSALALATKAQFTPPIHPDYPSFVNGSQPWKERLPFAARVGRQVEVHPDHYEYNDYIPDAIGALLDEVLEESYGPQGLSFPSVLTMQGDADLFTTDDFHSQAMQEPDSFEGLWYDVMSTQLGIDIFADHVPAMSLSDNVLVGSAVWLIHLNGELKIFRPLIPASDEQIGTTGAIRRTLFASQLSERLGLNTTPSSYTAQINGLPGIVSDMAKGQALEDYFNQKGEEQHRAAYDKEFSELLKTEKKFFPEADEASLYQDIADRIEHLHDFSPQKADDMDLRQLTSFAGYDSLDQTSLSNLLVFEFIMGNIDLKARNLVIHEGQIQNYDFNLSLKKGLLDEPSDDLDLGGYFLPERYSPQTAQAIKALNPQQMQQDWHLFLTDEEMESLILRVLIVQKDIQSKGATALLDNS